MTQEAAPYGENVEQVRRRFAEWRSTHAVRSRLPEELWTAAAELVEREGINATARALAVDKPSLRKWADRLQQVPAPKRRKSQPKRGSTSAPAFVELLASASGGVTNCLVEVESPQGGKLRLELKAIATTELAGLIRAFGS